MPNIYRTALITARCSIAALAHLACRVGGAWLPSADSMPDSLWQHQKGMLSADCRCSDVKTQDESEKRTNYAARLRAAFDDDAQEALVSREDAMGAAAEIEQLWAALWVVDARRRPPLASHHKAWLRAIAALPHEDAY
jgi:hypothetical protein